MLTKPLSELKPKEKGKIIKVGGEGDIRHRLLDMGLVSGSEVEVERIAPLGDPIEIKIKGYHLSLRKEEAANIQVEVEWMPLSMARPGELVQVVDVRAGWGLQRRLTDMGLLPGVQIKVINSQMPGPIIVDLRGSRLALGQGVAPKIFVTRCENG